MGSGGNCRGCHRFIFDTRRITMFKRKNSKIRARLFAHNIIEAFCAGKVRCHDCGELHKPERMIDVPTMDRVGSPFKRVCESCALKWFTPDDLDEILVDRYEQDVDATA